MSERNSAVKGEIDAAVSRNAAQRRLVDDLLALFGGRTQPVMTHLVETGKVTLEEVQEAEKLVRQMSDKMANKTP